MKFSGNKFYKKVDRRINTRILVYGVLIVLFAAMIISNQNLFEQAGFIVNDKNASIYLKGVTLDNQRFTSASQIKSADSNAIVSFGPDKIIVDFDGKLDMTRALLDVSYWEPSNIKGSYPQTTMEISNPIHVDLDGNKIPVATTTRPVYLDSSNHKVWQYDYMTTLKFTFDIEISPDGLYYIKIQGENLQLQKMCEAGFFTNLDALLSVNLPSDTDEWSYAWDMELEALGYRLTFDWTGPENETFHNSADIKAFLDENYVWRGLDVDASGWVGMKFYINNQGIKPSLSTNGPLPLETVDSTKVARIGFDSLYIPCVYAADFAYWLIFRLGYSSAWYFMKPTMEFDIRTKVFVIDKSVTQTNTTEPPPEIIPQFINYLKENTLAVVGVTVIGFSIVALISIRRRGSGGAAY